MYYQTRSFIITTPLTSFYSFISYVNNIFSYSSIYLSTYIYVSAELCMPLYISLIYMLIGTFILLMCVFCIINKRTHCWIFGVVSRIHREYLWAGHIYISTACCAYTLIPNSLQIIMNVFRV